jgi:micrococcal nuclease
MPLTRALATLAVVATSAGCGGSPCGETEAKVTRVIDGDTIELEDGRKIRYLLVDTPESTGGATDCYGTNAKDFNTDLVMGRTVTLSFDVECTDRFDRTLAYVYVDGQEVNSLMIERGYGCVLHIPPNGESRHEEFQALQLSAERAMRGLWGFCSPLPPACE